MSSLQFLVYSRQLRILIWTFFYGLLTQLSYAQNLQTKYPFLNLEKNKIDFYGDTTEFNSFFEKLDDIVLKGDGQVNVLHMGGSHVQGGTLSHTMRTNLQSIVPGLKGQRGLLFPFALAKTNNPWNYVVKKRGNWEGARVSVSNHHSNWGVSGVSATTYSVNSGATIYAREESDKLSFERVRIFYDQCECSFSPKVNNPGLVSTHIDSAGSYMEFAFDQAQDTLYFGLEMTDSTQGQFILQGMQFLSDEPSIVYNPVGVNGAKTSDYLRSQAFPEQVKMIAADLVIFGIGINDANTYAKKFNQREYESNYLELIKILRVANPDVSILFMTNNDSYFQKRYPNPNAYKVRDAMINVAKKVDGAVWDLFEIMGGFDSIRFWEAYGIASADKIHFKREGYQLQADLLFTALRKSYGDYLSARFQP